MTREDMIREGLNLLSELAHKNAVDHGFHEDSVLDRIDGLTTDDDAIRAESNGRMLMVRLMLIVTELAEAAEAYRDNGLAVSKMFYLDEKGKPEGIAAELADVAIRLGDLCGAHGIDLGKAVEVKMAYNKTRPMRHGGKAA